jgi:hypothetical protein
VTRPGGIQGPAATGVVLILLATVGCSAADSSARPEHDNASSTRTPFTARPATPPASTAQPGSPCARVWAVVPGDPGVPAKPRVAPGRLYRLQQALGVGFAYDFTGSSTFNLVVDPTRRGHEPAVRHRIVALHLHVPVTIVDICRPLTELADLRREIGRLGRSVDDAPTMAISVSPARAQVDVIVWPRSWATVLRHRYGDRVRVSVGQIHLTRRS